jgi:hypothetical protein
MKSGCAAAELVVSERADSPQSRVLVNRAGVAISADGKFAYITDSGDAADTDAGTFGSNVMVVVDDQQSCLKCHAGR